MIRRAALALATALPEFSAPRAASPGLDAFGIARFHPARAGTREWNSAHWADGIPRPIRHDGDPADPAGWSDNHSSGGGDSLFVGA